jgi:hypothetical protein
MAMDMGTVSPRVDMAKMSAWATISTNTPDRSEDVVEPTGVLLDNYRKNPVVLWDHGFGGINVPIGKCEDSDGNLAMTVMDEAIEAGCFFAQSCWEACQIFELIVEKIIRATSIGFRPLEAEPRTKGLDRPGLWIKLWELFEWSWVIVPDNPQALAKVLDGGKLAGRAIAEPLLKSLLPFKPKVTPTGKGFTMPEANVNGTGEGAPATGTAPTEVVKSEGGNVPAGGGETVTTKAAEPGDTPTPGPGDAGPDDESGEDGMKDAPLGAQILSAAFAGISGLASALTASVGPLEHPEIKEYAAGLSDQLNGMLADIEETYGKTYPDAPGLKACEEQDSTGKAVAKFLQQGSVSRTQLAGLSFRLKGLSASTRLNSAEKDLLKSVMARIDRIVTDARKSAAAETTKGVTPPPASPAPAPTTTPAAPSVTPEMVKALSDAVLIFKDAGKALKDAMPARAAA